MGIAASPIIFGSAALAAPLNSAAPITAPRSRRSLLTAIVDTILPDTDTPGASAAGVVDFIEMMMAHWLHPDENARLLAGLAQFEVTVRAVTGQDFAALPPARRLAVLQSMASAEGESKVASPQTAGSFIAQLRALTVFGYYTSEIGASKELDLNLVPGQYEPCHAIEPGEHAVSLGRSNAVMRMP